MKNVKTRQFLSFTLNSSEHHEVLGAKNGDTGVNSYSGADK